MVGQSTWKAHPHLAWAMWGLDEIEATLTSFENNRHKHPDVTKAESVVADMRTARDAFRKSIENKSIREPKQMKEDEIRGWKAELERQWVAFEDSLQAYVEALGKQFTEQETVFRARADAQSKAWQQAIEALHKSAEHFSANHRGELVAAINCLESEANASRGKLDELNRAEGASWDLMKSALTETRAALGKAHQVVTRRFAARIA